MSKKPRLGKDTKTGRGFPRVDFIDGYDKPCSIQCSSAIGDYEDSFERPGTSYLWLGLDRVEPRILASQAASVGIYTDQTTGWVDYPIPDAVCINPSMHLNREQVAGLIERLQKWLDTGTLYDERSLEDDQPQS